MEHLDRQPAAQRQEPRAVRIVVSDLHLHVGDRAVRDLLMGVEHRRLDARMRRPREADDHPLGEERAVVGPGEEVAPAPRTTPNRSGTAARTSFSDPSRGHQNSSASALTTQSASCSVAASRAMRVTHSA